VADLIFQTKDGSKEQAVHMPKDKKLSRRQFIQTGISSALAAGAGGIAAWTLVKGRQSAKVRESLAKPTGDEWARFATVDPSLIVYKPAGEFGAELRRPRRIMVTRDGRVALAGDTAVLVFDRQGNRQSVIQLNRPPYAIAQGPDGNLYVALHDHVDVYGLDGAPLASWPNAGENAWLTSVAFAGDQVYLADAGNREILRCDPNGSIKARFGRRGVDHDNPGFIVPSPYFAIAPTSDGKLTVNNPGRHRVERYTLQGEFETAWGEASYAADGFCGCCNPVYVQSLSDGSTITSEKGLTRIKVYRADGTLKGFVASPEQLGGGDLAAAQQATDDCRKGCGFDVAADADNRVLVLDPIRRVVKIYEPIA
jgi:hypothetical protein